MIFLSRKERIRKISRLTKLIRNEGREATILHKQGKKEIHRRTNIENLINHFKETFFWPSKRTGKGRSM